MADWPNDALNDQFNSHSGKERERVREKEIVKG